MYVLASGFKGGKIRGNKVAKSSLWYPVYRDVVVGKIKRNELETIRNCHEIDYVEENFKIFLRGNFEGELASVPEHLLVGYIGGVNGKIVNWHKYNGGRQEGEDLEQETNQYIGYSEKGAINAVEYLMFIIEMMRQAISQHKQLVIYADIEIEPAESRYRSLLKKCVNDLLEEIGGIIVYKAYGPIREYYTVTTRTFEPYIDRGIYTTDGIEVALKKVIRLMEDKCPVGWMKKAYRLLTREMNQGLYDDIFYKQIPSDEFIYVPLLPTSTLDKELVERLGIEYIELLGGGLLRATKGLFDKHEEILKNSVIPQYTTQILTYPPIRLYEVDKKYQIKPRDEEVYNGAGVCLGLIGTNGIDYRHKAYKKQDGSIKVAYVWEQIEGGEGRNYTNQDIKKAIENNVELSICGKNCAGMENILAQIIGGETDSPKGTYRGIATEAEIIVAKINAAAPKLQEIYGGIPNEQAVLLEDMMIGINELIVYAKKQEKPLVLVIPYAAGVSSHDGVLILEKQLGAYGNQTGVTLVTSTGEEADKAHHVKIVISAPAEVIVEINIEKENQNVIGGMWLDPFGEKKITLYSPKEEMKGYELNKEGITNTEQIKLLTTGSRVSEYNGMREIQFRMQNPAVGTWQMKIDALATKGYTGGIEIWLAQQELNPYTILSPNNPFTTITSLGNVQGILCIGDYDNDTLTTYKNSGRGYTRQNIVNPILVAQGTEILEANQEGEGTFAAGSLVAMANMAGVVAAVYSKAIVEKVNRLPSSAGMAGLLLNEIERVETVEYPNPSQGNGIFNRASLKRILDPATPIKL